MKLKIILVVLFLVVVPVLALEPGKLWINNVEIPYEKPAKITAVNCESITDIGNILESKTNEDGSCTTIFQPDEDNGKDSTIYKDQSGNFGSHYLLLTGSFDNGLEIINYNSLIEFDLRKIPKNSEVLSARLSLYYDNEYCKKSIGNTGTIEIKALNTNWEENTVTWDLFKNTFYSENPYSTLTFNIKNTGKYLELNINDEGLQKINDWLNYESVNNGFFLTTKSDGVCHFNFYSSDGKGNLPKFEITYILGEEDKEHPAKVCELTSAVWGVNEVKEGEIISLIVEGKNCNEKSVTFELWKDVKYWFDSQTEQPKTAIFSGDKAEVSWTTVYSDKEYYFKAILDEDNSVKLKSGNLKVTKIAKVSGTSLEKAGELLEQAIKKKRISYCDNIENENLKNTCYGTYAVQYLDESSCNSISENTLKNLCEDKTSLFKQAKIEDEIYETIEITKSGLVKTKEEKITDKFYVLGTFQKSGLSYSTYATEPWFVIYEEELKYNGKKIEDIEIIEASVTPYFKQYSCYELTKKLNFVFEFDFSNVNFETKVALQLGDSENIWEKDWGTIKKTFIKCSISSTEITNLKDKNLLVFVDNEKLVLRVPTYFAKKNILGQDVTNHQAYYPYKPEEFRFSYKIRGKIPKDEIQEPKTVVCTDWGDGCVDSYHTSYGDISKEEANKWCEDEYGANYKCIDCNDDYDYIDTTSGCVAIDLCDADDGMCMHEEVCDDFLDNEATEYCREKYSWDYVCCYD